MALNASWPIHPTRSWFRALSFIEAEDSQGWLELIFGGKLRGVKNVQTKHLRYIHKGTLTSMDKYPAVAPAAAARPFFPPLRSCSLWGSSFFFITVVVVVVETATVVCELAPMPACKINSSRNVA